MCLNRLVETLSNRPRVFFKDKSIIELSAFISGYCFCLDESDKENFPHCKELKNFSSWLANKCECVNDSGWEDILRNQYGGEEQGFDKFFELWKEFWNNNK